MFSKTGILLLVIAFGLPFSATAAKPENLQYHEIGKAHGVGVVDAQGKRAGIFAHDEGFTLMLDAAGTQKRHDIDFKPTHATFAPGRHLVVAGQLPANQKHAGAANRRAVVFHDGKTWTPSMDVTTWSLAARANRILFVGRTHGRDIAQVYDLDGQMKKELPFDKWRIDNHDRTVSLGPDGKRIAFGGFALRKAARMYDLDTEQEIRIRVEDTQSERVHPLVEGNAVVELDDGSILFWNDGETVKRHRPRYKDHEFQSVEASPGGQYVAASVSDGYGLYIFDATGKVIYQRDPFSRVHGNGSDDPQLKKHYPMWQGDQVTPHFLNFEWVGDRLSVELGDEKAWVYDPGQGNGRAIVQPNASRTGKMTSINR